MQKKFKISKYRILLRRALLFYLESRKASRELNGLSQRIDIGERGSVTSGKHMEGFINVFKELVQDAGIENSHILTQRRLLTLPGFFRPTKMWDILIMQGGRLLAAIEMKSQMGPSFGNNFNNRAEESLGSALDFWKAFKEGSMGEQREPFLGWIMLVEECSASMAPVTVTSPHYDVFPEFKETSYIQRYDILCQKLMQERLYRCASLMAFQRKTPSYRSISASTCIENLINQLFYHLAGYQNIEE